MAACIHIKIENSYLSKNVDLKIVKERKKYCHSIFLLPTYTYWKKAEEEGGGVCGK